MTGHSRLTLRPAAAAVAALILFLGGAAVSYLLMPGRPGGPTADAVVAKGAPQQEAASPGPASTALPAGPRDIAVTLTPDAVARAGLVVSPVAAGRGAGTLRLPGVVEANAYRQVEVTPLVGGRLTRVAAALGENVRRGEILAEVYSPELAEAQAAYRSARAMLEAHDRELTRVQRLAEIGSASRQELERIHAEHAAATAAVEAARTRLELLGAGAGTGATEAPVSATVGVPAPLDGTVTERLANVGLNVDPGTKLFTLVDLSTVWVVAELYERDFSSVRPGTRVTVTTAAYPELALEADVDYVDPEVNRDTRTARIRVEVPNARRELRPGMYADVTVASAGGDVVPVVPRSAVQHVHDRTVVYTADAGRPGVFVERDVQLGDSSDEQVTVLAGVETGDLVVTSGSFYLRAEVERLGLRPPASSGAAEQPAGPGAEDMQLATVIVSERGFEPERVAVRAGRPVRLIFRRTTDRTCGTEVTFPSLNITRALPLNEAVAIEFTPERPGDVEFACAMDMLRGTLVVTP